MMFSHSESAHAATVYTLSRMLETAVGIVVAVAVNRILPTPKQPDQVVAQVERLEEAGDGDENGTQQGRP